MKVANTLIVMLFLVTSGLSQEQVIDESTFNAAMRRSPRPVREWQGKARRISKTNEEEFSNLPGLNHLYEEVTEYDAAGSSRSLWKITGPQGRKSEMVKIGSTTFTRKGIDNWSRNDAPSSESTKPVLPLRAMIITTRSRTRAGKSRVHLSSTSCEYLSTKERISRFIDG